jgi:hypothetical protein
VATLVEGLPRPIACPFPKHAPFAIGYAFEDKPHDYLPDVVGTLTNGKLFIAEVGMEDDKWRDRNLAKADAARRLARLKRDVFWIGTERQRFKRRHYNLVFLHARRKTFPVFADIAPGGDALSVKLPSTNRCVPRHTIIAPQRPRQQACKGAYK